MAKFKVGDTVHRNENRADTAALVLEVLEDTDGFMYHIVYDEGGDGWWPETALAAEPE